MSKQIFTANASHRGNRMRVKWDDNAHQDALDAFAAIRGNASNVETFETVDGATKWVAYVTLPTFFKLRAAGYAA